MLTAENMTDLLLTGDALEQLRQLPDNSVDMCLTSPPYYGLRDYGVDGQFGQEAAPEAYIRNLASVLMEVRRVLKPTGTLWLNLGDSYAGSSQGAGTRHPSAKQQSNRGTRHMLESDHRSRLYHADGYKPKDLMGIPWQVALTLREQGWYLRQDIIWQKPNAMPESVRDRCTKSHEYLFLLSKSRQYYFDYAAIREPCTEASQREFAHRKTFHERNKAPNTYSAIRPDLYRSRKDYHADDNKRHARDVWSINTESYKGAHFATFPTALAQRCILAGCPPNGLVLDPFIGSGTTAQVAKQLNRHYVGIDLNPDYIQLAKERIETA